MTDQPSLPGLEGPAAGGIPNGPMVESARTTLAALRSSGRLETRHAVLVQLVLSLAGAIDRGVQSGRASAVAMAAKQLLETMLVLDPPPEDAGAPDAGRALAEFMAALEDHANGDPLEVDR